MKICMAEEVRINVQSETQADKAGEIIFSPVSKILRSCETKVWLT